MSLPLQHVGSLLEHKEEKKNYQWKSKCIQYHVVTEAKIHMRWS